MTGVSMSTDRGRSSIDGVFEEFSVKGAIAACARRPHRMLIDGNWVEAASGLTLSIVEPSTGLELTTVPRGR